MLILSAISTVYQQFKAVNKSFSIKWLSHLHTSVYTGVHLG